VTTQQYTTSAFPALPQRLAGLADLAGNLSWSWNRDARALFRALDEHLWVRVRYDPVALLEQLSPERLARRSANPDFLARYDRVMAWMAAEQSSDHTWFAKTHPELRTATVAYFCAEFGLYHSVPIYSGGLGILAGDHCKAASDLGVPLVGVGILYRGGYFDQRIRIDGWQEETHDHFEPNRPPLEPMHGPDGAPLVTVVPTFGRDVYIRVWQLRVGRVPLYLLDTELDDNHPDDRPLLSRLYVGDSDHRLRQEWLLGVGGVRVLRALNIHPTAWHANEGHATFMLVERLREFVLDGVALPEAVRRVRATSTFTTHTPVPAGHDIFRVEVVSECMATVWKGTGVAPEDVLRLGAYPPANGDAFHMTAAGIRLSRHVNGVSRAHGEVTRHIWAPLWPDERPDTVPISHVTNGVHVATWMANPMIHLLDALLGEHWGASHDDPALWEQVLHLDDGLLWATHHQLKLTLFSLIREEARRAFAGHGRDASQLAGSGLLLDPDALTIGFARRFATYKRASLIFHDVERLLRLITDAGRPVQFVFAGKAHPADTPGKHVLQDVYRTTRDPRFEGRIAFVEDYDLHLAHVLVQGVDLWLNVPRVPLEASGTSGMKAALNGVPQLSTLDGWWAEGFNGHNGWTIATPAVEGDDPDAEASAAAQLYDLLEREVVPAFYERDAEGRPTRWLAMMKHALRVAGQHFTARRMVTEYVAKCYLPSFRAESVPGTPPRV
jgi:starch phosphorylase